MRFRPILVFAGLTALVLAALWLLPRPGPLPLASGASLKRSFLPQEREHSFGVDLRPGQLLEVSVEPAGRDVAVLLIDTSGRTGLEIDSSDGAWGREQLWWVARRKGRLRLLVEAVDPPGPGRYRLRLGIRDAPTPGDRARVRATLLMARNRPVARPEEELGEALRLWRETGEERLAVLTWMRIAAARSRQGFDREMEAYRSALDLAHRSGDRRLEIEVRRRLGHACRLAGRLDAAWDWHDSARALARSLGDRRQEAMSLQNLAVIEDERNEPQRALQLYRQALEALRQIRSPAAEVATVQHNMGNTLSLLGSWDEALASLEEALRLHRGLGEDARTAATLIEIGWIHYLQKQPAQAADAFREALGLYRRQGDRTGESAALDRLGTALRASGHWDEAEAAYTEALRLCRQRGSRRDEANTLANLAELFLERGQPQRAGEPLARARKLFAGLPAHDRHAEIHVLSLQARRAGALEDFKAALEGWEEVWRLTEAFRGALASQALSLPFFATRRVYLDHHLDLLMSLSRRDPGREWDRRALETAERGRARGFLETLLARSVPAAGRDEELRRRRDALRARLNALEQERLALDKRDPPRAARLLEEQRHRAADLADLEALVRRTRLRTEPAVVGLPELQALLDPETVLLYFHLGDERSFLWLVGPETLESHLLPARARIEAEAARLTGPLRHGGSGRSGKEARLAALRLGRILLGPVRDRLEGKRLAVIADGALHRVPFATLLDPMDGRPLGPRHEIVRLPSGSVLAVLRERLLRPPGREAIAIFADPVFTADDPRVHHSPGSRRLSSAELQQQVNQSLLRSARDAGLRFERLGASRREGEAIASLLPGARRFLALDFAASRAAVLSAELAEFRTVHFATHAILHPLPDLSGLVLSLVDPSGRSQDGFVRAHELAGLDLRRADLVVLSACQTADGPEVLGEGVLGLPRGLFAAGARRVIVSLWNVEDEATAAFMHRFYQALFEEGRTAPAALRAAQAWMAEQERWRSPFYWAAFELQGDWR